MKTCLIPPIPDLERFVDESSTHHLLLSHLVDDYPYYARFYSQRAAAGDYVILDNGAKELGEGIGLARLLDQAVVVGAREVVLTDVRYKSQETIQAARKETEWLVSDLGRTAWIKAGKPRLMIVPQGETPSDWSSCLRELITLTHYALAEVGGPFPVIGVAYHYDHLFPFSDAGGLLTLLDDPALESHELHLLGWTRHLYNLETIRIKYPDRIRSVDSSRPFVYARKGLLCGEAPYPSRGDTYFSTPLPAANESIARKNIQTFRRYAGDEW